MLNGRFGPNIKKGKENFKIPKGTEAKTLTLADCVAIMETAAKEPAKKKRFFKKTK